jgi:ABC-type sugar transport system ATPase subunit
MLNSEKGNQFDVIAHVSNLTKVYPGVIAVNDVNMEFKIGEIHGIIGKNGAGKTTFVSILSGVVAPSSGEIKINNKIFKHLSRIEAKKQGINIVTQEPEVIPLNTIYESLFMPDFILTKHGFVDWKTIKNKTIAILHEVGLDMDINMRMNDLSISLQQLLAIIKCFYIEYSPIIILDESSASLSESDREILFNIIRKNKTKKAIIYISHRTDEILNICDVVTVLRDGRSIKTEKVKNLDKEKISSMIIGDIKEEKFKKDVIETDFIKIEDQKKEILKLESLNNIGKFENISMTIHKGEIVGLAGLRGSGRTEIMKAIVGIDPPYSGKIKLNGKEVKFFHPKQANRDGIVYLPEERDREGLIKILSVESNLNILILEKLLNRFGLINQKQEKRTAEKMIQKFQINCFNPDQEVKFLSGGNKQKVVLGKIYLNQPILYLLDEPTKGIDISTKVNILAMIKEELTENSGVIITSPGLDDLIQICDRIVILFEGKILDTVNRENFDEREIYLGMQGVVKNKKLKLMAGI